MRAMIYLFEEEIYIIIMKINTKHEKKKYQLLEIKTNLAFPFLIALRVVENPKVVLPLLMTRANLLLIPSCVSFFGIFTKAI